MADVDDECLGELLQVIEINMHGLLMLPVFIMVLSSWSTNPVVAGSAPDYYTAAVFEHARLGNVSDPPQETVRRNLNMYERATEVAASKGADIIVFPEYGIFPFYDRAGMKQVLEETPDPRQVTSNPCEQREEFSNRPILYTLSCMAKKHNMVVVADTGDIQPCIPQNNTKCPEDGVYHFNTLVAFNRNGTLISRYYKKYLFYEIGMDLPVEPQRPIFETDFGSFAMFICFDYVFLDIVKAAEEVDNIILSTLWMDRMPLSNSVQFFQAWALVNNVTYLASNINIPGYGSSGSGMFSGHSGAIKYTFNPDGLSKLVTAKIFKSKRDTYLSPDCDSSITVINENGTEEYNEDEDGKDVPEECAFDILGKSENIMKDYRCLTESPANYTLVKLTKLSDDLEVCNNGMCCSLSYSASSMNESYFFGVHNGTHSLVDRYFWCEENCMVVRCDPLDERECATFPTRSETVFDRIELKANFTTKYVYPSVLRSAVRLAPKDEWNHDLKHEDDSVNGRLKYESHSVEPLLVAGLNGRCYQRDPPYVR